MNGTRRQPRSLGQALEGREPVGRVRVADERHRERRVLRPVEADRRLAPADRKAALVAHDRLRILARLRERGRDVGGQALGAGRGSRGRGGRTGGGPVGAAAGATEVAVGVEIGDAATAGADVGRAAGDAAAASSMSADARSGAGVDDPIASSPQPSMPRPPRTRRAPIARTRLLGHEGRPRGHRIEPRDDTFADAHRQRCRQRHRSDTGQHGPRPRDVGDQPATERLLDPRQLAVATAIEIPAERESLVEGQLPPECQDGQHEERPVPEIERIRDPPEPAERRPAQQPARGTPPVSADDDGGRGDRRQERRQSRVGHRTVDEHDAGDDRADPRQRDRAQQEAGSSGEPAGRRSEEPAEAELPGACRERVERPRLVDAGEPERRGERGSHDPADHERDPPSRPAAGERQD